MSTSKRIVLTTFGSLGDLHPYLALALELKARGYEAIIAANGAHQGRVEAEGIAFHAVRPDVGDFGNESALMKKIMNLRSGPEFVIRQLLMPTLRDSYEDITAACSGADLLVSHPLTLTAPLVAEKMRGAGLSWASVGIAPSVFLSAFDPPIFAPAPGLYRFRIFGPRFYGKLLQTIKKTTRSWIEPWHQFRAEIGLPFTDANPMFDGQFSSQLVLALFSSVLAAPQPDWPSHTVQTGFPFYDGQVNERIDPKMEAFLNAGEAPIVFTLGSAAVMDAGSFYDEAAEAARRLGKRALLLVGRDARNRPTTVSEDVAVFEYAPYFQVFPHACAVVHQGGVGTTAQALRAGRPMLVIPFGFDQPDNAARVTRLGVARTLPRNQFTANRAEAELRRLMGAQYRAKAEEIGHQVRSENGTSLACNNLERLLEQSK